MELAIPTPLVYWKRPWSAAHVYTECPRFIRDWAGRDFLRHRTATTVRQAARHTNGICGMCLRVYLEQVNAI